MEIDLHGKTHPEGLELIEEYMLLNSTKGSVSLNSDNRKFTSYAKENN